MEKSFLRLRRIKEYGETTLGKLTIDGVDKTWYILEPGGPDSKIAGSDKRILHGSYTMKPYSSVKYPSVYQIMNVPGRTKILMHAGNYHQNTEGCLMPGMSFNRLPDKHYFVGQSKKALNEIFEELKDKNQITIIIKNTVTE